MMLLSTGVSGRAAETAKDLVGAWRGGVQFTTGDFAAVKDLEKQLGEHLGTSVRIRASGNGKRSMSEVRVSEA